MPIVRASQVESAGVTSMADETLRAIQTVHAFTQEANERSNFDEQVQKAFGASIRRNLAGSRSPAPGFPDVDAGDRHTLDRRPDVARGAITAGDLTAFVIYSVLASSIGSLSEVWGDSSVRPARATELSSFKTKPMILRLFTL